ncbi:MULTISPECIES: TRAP transporter small permease subunit [Bradyrhizobium]|jgi:TRAP-type C4-dicarboxylate transport system permease small subunit|uniref:TRAP transporter small permease subunit n=1 Tax=Bradyrhizobium TaxID=374 RepID=UPI000231C77C|nr:TRAP transporter small permease [Bradyrhizobium japonicum]AJA60833.1 C4-dicarboxylate ABC transporter permease [Bradyrhizobium japonicum]KMK00571.1 C4-dicarboxylate ABC transporter permease [Bradyrhizobium japonicum]MBR0733992.1 TRAP transporter small permease [Bradyrhizobium japonicum]MBR0766162.1 TRAP transporter small permease [Bradyrhizobium japonicum]MBR0808685.1 TRAP transporter small permease [Bradyrhizobium japonicum]
MVSVSPAAPQSLNAAAPGPLRILLDGIDRLGRLDGWIGGGCLLTLTLLMLCEVATRFLSNFLPFFPPSISIAWEYSSYLMAASFTFGAAMTLRVGGHIRVVLLLKNVPAPLQRALEILSAAAGFAFMAFLTSAMAKFAFGAYVRGQVSTSSDTPLWFPEAVVTFGMLLLTLQFLARAIQAALGLPLEDHSMKANPVE